MPDAIVQELADGGVHHFLPPHAHHRIRRWGIVLIVGGLALAGGAGYLLSLAWPDAFLTALTGMGVGAGVILGCPSGGLFPILSIMLTS